ncbi:MAG: hypothetical protein Q8K58_07385 [Acidimicrobiales bacterium]|nr:hypothetical protein [Acidimicrobiales bacterium]
MKEDRTLGENGPNRSVLSIRATAEPSGPARAVRGYALKTNPR